MVKTVAARLPAAADTHQLGFDHGLAEQDHQPVQRTHEAVVVITPAHRLGDGECLDGFGEDFGQYRLERLAHANRLADEALALVRHLTAERRNVNTVLGRKAEQRRRRLTGGIEADRYRGAQHPRTAIRLLRGHPRQMDGQSAWCAEVPRSRAVGGLAEAEEAAFESLDDGVQESLGQRVDGADRQLLGAEFDQQRPARWLSHAPSPCASAPGSRDARAARRRSRPRRATARARAGWCAGVR